MECLVVQVGKVEWLSNYALEQAPYPTVPQQLLPAARNSSQPFLPTVLHFVVHVPDPSRCLTIVCKVC